MLTDEHAAADRVEVVSADGTTIAVWIDGVGPPMVLVHGSLQDHAASGALAAALRGHTTTFSMDRRGHGASDDGADYSIEREFEDVAAVVDVAAGRAGERVTVFGHSYGANCAMGGAALSPNVRRLVLYEPSLGLAYPDRAVESIERKIAAGDDEGALLELLVDVVGMTDDEIVATRSNPYLTWEARLAMVRHQPREIRTETGWRYEPGRFARVGAPTLMLTGSESPPAIRRATDDAAAALPDAHIVVLEGHGHVAHRTEPEMVAGLILAFARE